MTNLSVRHIRVLFAMALCATLMLGSLGVGLADHVDFPSSNDDNRSSNLPHVNDVDTGIGEVTLQFVNPTNSLTCFEVRTDGQIRTEGTPHPNPRPWIAGHNEFIYPNYCVDGRGIADTVERIETFNANQMVEVRLALGGERDWDFDWIPFYVEAMTADHCKKGGWQDFGFRNQGLCIQFVNTGKDSR